MVNEVRKEVVKQLKKFIEGDFTVDVTKVVNFNTSMQLDKAGLTTFDVVVMTEDGPCGFTVNNGDVMGAILDFKKVYNS